MVRAKVPLVDESGKTMGYGDRWWTHRVRKGPDGPVLGRKHVGITIACIDDKRRILIAHRRHKIFDKVWTLTGDTHPYRMYGSLEVETLEKAGRRCAMDDLGVMVKNWTRALTVSYSARDLRNPSYCENELLNVLSAKHNGPLDMNEKNAYELRWADPTEIWQESIADLKKESIERMYAPWVHAVFSLPLEKVNGALMATHPAA